MSRFKESSTCSTTDGIILTKSRTMKNRSSKKHNTFRIRTYILFELEQNEKLL